MMSLQTSTHSSQMKTVGPAISLRTSFWSLLQKEHRRTSVSPAFLTIQKPCRSRLPAPGSQRRCARGLMAEHWQLKAPCLRPFADDIVNNTVFPALISRHDVVALGVVLNPLERLAGV